MPNSIAKFNEYTTENVYITDDEGNIIKKDTYYYKDHYPEKYDYNPDSMKFVWIIKHNDEKVMILKGTLEEELVKKITDLFLDGLQLGQMDRVK